jgi:flagellin-specific chaperone FliS
VGTQNCSVCKHAASDQIDGDLRAGETIKSVAEKYALSKSAVDRHKRRHFVNAPPVSLEGGKPRFNADGSTREQLEATLRSLNETLDRALKSGALSNATQILREIRQTIEALAKTSPTDSTSSEASEWKRETIIRCISMFCTKCAQDLADTPRSMVKGPIYAHRDFVTKIRDIINDLLAHPQWWDSNGVLIAWNDRHLNELFHNDGTIETV